MQALREVPQYFHLNRATGRYLAQVRSAGCRKWTNLGKPVRNVAVAARRMATGVALGRKRGRVLFIDDSPYYDPHLVMEAKRR